MLEYSMMYAHSLFSGVEIMDLMSDLGAYASLLYTAALTGTIKVVYTVVVAFALVASLHGVHTRAMIILDMQEVRRYRLRRKQKKSNKLLRALGWSGVPAVLGGSVSIEK